MSISCPISLGAQNCPHKQALVGDAFSFSYLALDNAITSCAQELTSAGVRHSERIAFIAHVSWHTIVLLFALWRLQAIACPLSPRLPKAQLTKARNRLKAHHFFSSTEQFLCTQNHSFRKTKASSEWAPSQLATLLFTSGTTGEPKIAAHSIGNHAFSALGSNQVLSLVPEDRWLLSLPLHHVGGLGILFRCFFATSCVVLSELPLALNAHAITHLSLVPTQLYRLLKITPPLPPLKSILIGGAPLPLSLYLEAQTRNLPVYASYGLTEMSSQVATDFHPTVTGQSISCGTPLPYREVSLATDGEILVRGKTLFQGYWEEETECALPLTTNGWFATKDLGMWSSDQKLIVTGRKDALFISGGENIQPEEIENALLTLPGIVQAVVIPIPDAEFGHRPAAFISSETPYTLEEICAGLTPLLPRYKFPVRVLPLPLSSGGKVSRSQLLKDLTFCKNPENRD